MFLIDSIPNSPKLILYNFSFGLLGDKRKIRWSQKHLDDSISYIVAILHAVYMYRKRVAIQIVSSSLDEILQYQKRAKT